MTSTENRRVRPAQSTELPAIVALINEAYLVESFFVEGPRITSEAMAALIAAGEIFVLREPSNEILATARFHSLADAGHLGLISVQPSLQGQGLGRCIIAALEDIARSQGCITMHIQVVNLRNELPPYYQRLGYTQTGTSPFADPARATQAVHFLEMQKPLRPE